MLGDNIKSYRIALGLSQSELGAKLGLSSSTIGMYEQNRRAPDIDILKQMAVVFSCSVDELIGFNSDGIVFDGLGADEKAFTFTQKLLNQLNFEGSNWMEEGENNEHLKKLAFYLKVEPSVILEWIYGKSDSYKEYYSQLSEYFSVSETYWITPGAISPGIRPNMEEYLLILLHRQYVASGDFNSAYGSLEDYFPGIQVITDQAEADLIRDFRKMNQDSKDIVKGKCKEVLRTQRYDEANEDAMELPKASGKY